MKTFKKDVNSTGQSTIETKKPQKHDANLQKNSSLYFQIGLILCLLGTYALFEMQFQETKINFDTVESNDLATIDYAEKFRVEPEVVLKPKQEQTKRTVILNTVIEVPDNTVIKDPIDFIISDPTPVVDTPVAIGSLPDDIKIVDPVDVPFILIEKVPVYPGCEKYTSNDARKKCMSDKITKLIGQKFNTGIGSEYGISGRQRITTQFTINKNGAITDVKVRGPHQVLEREANRVINLIPKMEPGLQRNLPVGVIYTLPIVFDVRN